MRALTFFIFAILALRPSVCFADTAEQLAAKSFTIRAHPPAVQVTAGYGQLINHGAKAAILTKVSTSRGYMIEVHETIEENGMSQMRELSQLQIPAKKSATFKPRGLHLMIMGIQKPLVAGDKVPLTFHFQNGKTIKTHAFVKKMTL